MKRFFKKLLYAAITCILLLTLLVIFHVPILRFAGNVLIHEDKMERVEALFVLSGDPFDRGNEAIALYRQGYAGKIVCTGENVPPLFMLINVEYPESELTQLHLLSQGVPFSDVDLLCKGTSTKEEAEYILSYCKEKGIKKLGIVSTRFHTTRIRLTFKKQFEREGLHLIIRGSPSSVYDENYWWKSENGLIFVNNEYIKLGYYLLKGYLK